MNHARAQFPAPLARRRHGIFSGGKALLFALPLMALLSSCFGVKLDIRMNRDGSGVLDLEYRIIESLDSLGKLDGNERWNTIPVGEADFRRSLERLPETRLLSFSSKHEGKDLLIRAKMEFESVRGLMSFLDSSGLHSSCSTEPEGTALTMVLNEGSGVDTELSELIADAFDSYEVSVSVTVPGEGSLALFDSEGNPLNAIPGSGIEAAGKRVSFNIPLYEVLSASGGISAEFRW